MSQSDYIRYKKISNQLLEVSKLNAVLDSRDYTEFKQYYLESNIPISKTTLNKLNLQGYNTIFDINKKILNCPIDNFTMCNNTNLRDNRVLVTDHRTDAYEVNIYPIKTIIQK
jgi:hypothetical protein